jgi:hypothetical protein
MQASVPSFVDGHRIHCSGDSTRFDDVGFEQVRVRAVQGGSAIPANN